MGLENSINKGKNQSEGRNETSAVKDIDTFSRRARCMPAHKRRNETSAVKDIDTRYAL